MLECVLAYTAPSHLLLQNQSLIWWTTIGLIFLFSSNNKASDNKGFFWEHVLAMSKKKNKNENEKNIKALVLSTKMLFVYRICSIEFAICDVHCFASAFCLSSSETCGRGAGSGLGKYGRTIKWPVIYAKPNWIVNGIKGIVWFWKINCMIFGLNVFSGLVLFW